MSREPELPKSIAWAMREIKKRPDDEKMIWAEWRRSRPDGGEALDRSRIIFAERIGRLRDGEPFHEVFVDDPNWDKWRDPCTECGRVQVHKTDCSKRSGEGWVGMEKGYGRADQLHQWVLEWFGDDENDLLICSHDKPSFFLGVLGALDWISDHNSVIAEIITKEMERDETGKEENQ